MALSHLFSTGRNLGQSVTSTMRDGFVMGWAEAMTELGLSIASRAELISAGATSGGLTSAVRGGHLIRVRRDHYALPGLSHATEQAVRVGGKLGCVSALRNLGIFAIKPPTTHIRLDREASRCRNPEDRRRPLTAHRSGTVLHWGDSVDPAGGNEFCMSVMDALADVVHCQPKWLAIASVDNALFQGFIEPHDVYELFVGSAAQREMAQLVNGRAEAGQESVLRGIAHDAGWGYEVQRSFEGVGRVDTFIEGLAVAEADSRLAHDGWSLHVKDRDRDLALAALGIPSVRPVFNRIIYTPGDVQRAIAGLLSIHSRFRTYN
ncbi:MAG: hypothetical protein ACOH19_02625 [Rhodoglobus sp.]